MSSLRSAYGGQLVGEETVPKRDTMSSLLLCRPHGAAFLEDLPLNSLSGHQFGLRHHPADQAVSRAAKMWRGA